MPIWLFFYEKSKELNPKITLVVAMNKNNVIGVNNELPWHIPEDLAYFKRVTLGKPIIMGRKTFESIGRVLPGRRNLVITRNSDWAFPGVEVYRTIPEALSSVNDLPEVCIIGGGEVFSQSIGIANCLHLTVVEVDVPNPTAFFPEVNLKEWKLISHNEIVSQSNIKCSFNQYERQL